MEMAEQQEPYESRGSRTDLGEPGGESPPGHSTMSSTRDFMAVHIRSGNGHYRTNPLAQFADWTLASDEAALKGEAYLLQKELISKDAFPYQSVRVDHS